MKNLESYRLIVEKTIKRLILDKEPNDLYQSFRYLLHSGGKRIRSSLVLMAYNLYKEDLEESTWTALSIELFHNFTLAHDDIMDNAEFRRNKAPIHRKWNIPTAILSGDVILIYAYRLLAKAVRKNIGIMDVFNKMAVEVCEGQQYDMDFEKKDRVVDVEDYIMMITKKTAVLFGTAFKIGAMQAGAPDRDVNYLYEFGKQLGIAFQIEDDYLDLYSKASDNFGKLIGGDIIGNKKTFMLLKAKSIAKADQAKELENLMAMQRMDYQEKINGVKKIFEQLNIPEITKKEIDFYYQSAMVYLDSVEVTTIKKKALKELTLFLKTRKN